MHRTELKTNVRRMPLVGASLVRMARRLRQPFHDSASYWERRYAHGGTSGAGSFGALAQFKADVLNEFVRRNNVESVIEFGCGDGQQLALAKYPRYLGFDVSPTTIAKTIQAFCGDLTKSFALYDPHRYVDSAGMINADLTISLDVIYHLVEDEVYALHLKHVFGSARRYVILYTSDAATFRTSTQSPAHVRHRPIVQDIANLFADWRMVDTHANRHPYRQGDDTTSFASFFVYERTHNGSTC